MIDSNYVLLFCILILLFVIFDARVAFMCMLVYLVYQIYQQTLDNNELSDDTTEKSSFEKDYSEYPGAVDTNNLEQYIAPNEAYTNHIVGDENMVMQGISRNDPKRPTKGILRRADIMRPLVEESLQSQEARIWWGQSEN